MRYALISDIHGNLEAFQAVLDVLSKEEIGGYLCVGDVVGYGADPGECIKLVKFLRPNALIAGNHEWGVLGLLDPEYFNEYAREAIAWTKGVLSGGEMDYLRSFKLVHEDKDYTLVHGSLEAPSEFPYVLDVDDALRTTRLMKTPACFIGHSHAAGIFYFDEGKMEYTTRPRMTIDSASKCVVNVGSIGQPRDGDPRASFAVYDDASRTLEIKRVAYDVEKAQKKILKAGLPEILASRLAEGR